MLQTMPGSSGTPARENPQKAAVLTAKLLPSPIGEKAGVKRNCFSNILPFSPNVVFLCLPRNLTAASPRLLSVGEFIAKSYPIRTVIQLSNSPSIGSQREGVKITPSAIFFGICNDKKSRYTAHQISGRKSLALSLMKLCTGSEIQKPSMSAFSAPQADAAMERRSRNPFRRLPCVSFRYSVEALQ